MVKTLNILKQLVKVVKESCYYEKASYTNNSEPVAKNPLK